MIEQGVQVATSRASGITAIECFRRGVRVYEAPLKTPEQLRYRKVRFPIVVVACLRFLRRDYRLLRALAIACFTRAGAVPPI